jgi:hypothetical protein
VESIPTPPRPGRYLARLVAVNLEGEAPGAEKVGFDDAAHGIEPLSRAPEAEGPDEWASCFASSISFHLHIERNETP